MMRIMLFLLTGLYTGVAQAQSTAALIRTNGYIAPQFQAVFRPDARPVDQERIGMSGSKAGLIFNGTVTPLWRFRVHFVVGGDTINALTVAEPVDVDNNGTTDAIYTQSKPALSNMVVESSITYVPHEAVQFNLGRMRIPFTSQAQSPDTDLMFPERAGPNATFIRGSDMGGMVKTNFLDERILASAGVFNGISTNLFDSQRRGVLYTGRLDINPLGSFGFSETSEWKGPFRLGLGSGIIHNPYTAFDGAGYPTVGVTDTRWTASSRIAFYGLYLSGEFLMRQQLDSMSSRPEWATGWYGQAGWHLPRGLEPMFRMGEATVDESFDPRKTRWIDAGMNFYPAPKAKRTDQVKLTLQYLREERIDENETAQGMSARAQVLW